LAAKPIFGHGNEQYLRNIKNAFIRNRLVFTCSTRLMTKNLGSYLKWNVQFCISASFQN